MPFGYKNTTSILVLLIDANAEMILFIYYCLISLYYRKILAIRAIAVYGLMLLSLLFVEFILTYNAAHFDSF